MARAGQREGLLADLCAPGALDVVCSLLVSSREVRIAVPCAVLSTSKGAGSSSGVGSRVVISVLRRGPGTSLAIDCGRWWRGAPPGAVLMDAAELLQYANEDALRVLHRKLMAATNARSAGLARTQSVPGRMLFEGHHLSGSGSSGSSSGGGGGLHRTSSGGGLPTGRPAGGGASSLQRASSGGLLPGSGGGDGGASGLRRTSSTGLPPSALHRSGRPGGSCPRHPGSGGAGLHRLSAAERRTSRSPRPSPGPKASLAAASSPHTTPQKQAGASSAAASPAAGACSSGAITPEAAPLPGPAGYGDTALGERGGRGKGGPVRTAASPVSPVDLEQGPPSWESSAELSVQSVLSAGASAAGSGPCSPFGAPLASTPFCGGPGVDEEGSEGGGGLSRQGTFSQPFFAEFEEELSAASAAALRSGTSGSEAGTPPGAAPAALSAEDSGAARAAQLAAAREQMTAEELHEVASTFNHVFVPPWAVPPAPEQPTVRALREAAVQTGTGAAGERTPVRHTHTAEDAADHFQAFMQHFAASLPHLAMALADMHLARGGGDPTFVKSQYYFNALLQLKDEMGQLGERLQPAGRAPSL